MYNYSFTDVNLQIVRGLTEPVLAFSNQRNIFYDLGEIYLSLVYFRVIVLIVTDWNMLKSPETAW